MNHELYQFLVRFDLRLANIEKLLTDIRDVPEEDLGEPEVGDEEIRRLNEAEAIEQRGRITMKRKEGA